MSWSEFSLQTDKVLKELEVHHTVMTAHTWNNVYKSYARVQEESWRMKVAGIKAKKIASTESLRLYPNMCFAIS